MVHSRPAVKRPGPNRDLNHDPRKLRRRRLAAGLNIRALALKAGVSTGAISMLENGLTSASVDTLAALSGALDCAIVDLLPDEPQPAQTPRRSA